MSRDPSSITQVLCCAMPKGDNNHAVTGCEDGKLRLWRLSDGELEVAFTGHTEAVSDTADIICGDPSECLVVTGEGSGHFARRNKSCLGFK